MTPRDTAGAGAALVVLTSNATRPVLEALARPFERDSGRRVEVVHDSAKLMYARVLEDERGDVVVLGADAMDELERRGRLARGSRRPFAQSQIGIAVRAGAAHPDIATADALARTLLTARAIAHTVHGLSGMYAPELFRKLGIEKEVASKIVTRPGGLIGTLVASGEADIAVQQISELLAVPGIALVGPLPDEVQKTFESSAAVLASAREPELAAAFLHHCGAPGAESTYTAHGLKRSPHPLRSDPLRITS